MAIFEYFRFNGFYGFLISLQNSEELKTYTSTKKCILKNTTKGVVA